MKITDPEVIKNGEKDLIESVQEDLDIDAVREILKERMSVAALASKGGQIVVHNNEIAFRLDFEINLSGSLLFDREGNFIDSSKKEAPEMPDENHAESVDMDETEDFISQDFDSDQDLDNDLVEEDLSIDLPDYDLEDDLSNGPAPDLEMIQDPEADDEETGLDLDDELDLAAEELALEALEEDPPPLLADEERDDSDFAQTFDEENPFGDEEMDAQDLDDDINDILKESREFWEQKKD